MDGSLRMLRTLWPWHLLSWRCHVRDEPRCIALAADQLWSATSSRGAVIQCECGVVWITRTGCFHDTVLLPGESLALEPGVKLVIVALEPAVVRIERARHAKS